jgi:hypothetical protein
MNAAKDDQPETYRAEVDQQDGGPGARSETGGAENDVASGGSGENRNEDDEQTGSDGAASTQQDVHGDTDTVS